MINEYISVSLQALLLAICSTVLAMSWSSLVYPILISRRRDNNIIGQNLILIAIAFLGIFAFAYDQPELKKVIMISHQLIFVLFFLLIVIWIICVRIVKRILHTPTGQAPGFYIVVSRYIINLTGVISVIGCRFLLTETLISL